MTLCVNDIISIKKKITYGGMDKVNSRTGSSRPALLPATVTSLYTSFVQLPCIAKDLHTGLHSLFSKPCEKLPCNADIDDVRKRKCSRTTKNTCRALLMSCYL